MSEPNPPNLPDNTAIVVLTPEAAHLARSSPASDFSSALLFARKLMASSICPEHLVFATNPERWEANCFLVALQAIQWGLSPFAVAKESYIVKGTLRFQGKLVAGLVNARAGLVERLSFDYTGHGEGRTITVSGRFQGEKKPRTITIDVAGASYVPQSNDPKKARARNEMWNTDPDQKLAYIGALRWANRHCPELLLGCVFDADEPEQIVVEKSSPEIPRDVAKSSLPAARVEHVNGEAQTLQQALSDAEQRQKINDAQMMNEKRDDAVRALLTAKDCYFALNGYREPGTREQKQAEEADWLKILRKRDRNSIDEMSVLEMSALRTRLEELIAAKIESRRDEAGRLPNGVGGAAPAAPVKSS